MEKSFIDEKKDIGNCSIEYTTWFLVASSKSWRKKTKKPLMCVVRMVRLHLGLHRESLDTEKERGEKRRKKSRAKGR